MFNGCLRKLELKILNFIRRELVDSCLSYAM